MKIKAIMGATSDWLEVTPASQAHVEDLAPSDERAWQRDIAKAWKKSVKEKGQKKAHVPRETHVVRIPAVSADGYFRLALCTGDVDASRRKVLCLSPIFRVASTSSDSSVFRGASLSTMPIEVGVKVASLAASATIQKYTGPAVGLVQEGVSKLQPGLRVQAVGQVALERLADRAPTATKQYFPDRRTQTEPLFNDSCLTPVGPAPGPEPPFPLKFQGKVVPGTGRSQAELGMPTANLASLSPDNISHLLQGVYLGWACIEDTFPTRWHQAIISSSPSPYSRPAVVAETLVTAHLFHDFPAGLVNARLTVIVMSFMRHMLDPSASMQQRLDMVSRDVLLTVASLSREGWQPEVTVQRLRTVKSARGLSDRVADAREMVQRKVDEVPIHALGIRSARHEEKDQIYGRGGYWVAR